MLLAVWTSKLGSNEFKLRFNGNVDAKINNNLSKRPRYAGHLNIVGVDADQRLFAADFFSNVIGKKRDSIDSWCHAANTVKLFVELGDAADFEVDPTSSL